MKDPRSFLEAVDYFSDLDRANEYVTKMRWPYGVACPRQGCGSADVRYTKTRRVWFCKDCGRQFTAKVGTVFEDSPIGFDKWIPAMWLLAGCRNGISSCELARALGVTQKTAWFMLHRIRLAMTTGTFEKKLSGPVEADETYVGSRAHATQRNPITGHLMSPGPQANKTVVMGIVQREGKVRAFVIPETRRSLTARILQHVEAGETVYTDAAGAYNSLQRNFVHYVINHAVEYVNGHIHTNSIESFWAVFKRAVRGTYICPRPKHLQQYVEEAVYRFNARDLKDAGRLPGAVKGADGKRLTYRDLTRNRRFS